MVDQATMQRYSSLFSAVLASFGWYFCLKTFNFASTSGIHCFSLPGINNGECSGSAVFLKPGVLQPSYAILIQDGLGWQHPLGLKIWSWSGLIQEYSVLYGFWTLVLLRCPYYPTNLKYSIVGLERWWKKDWPHLQIHTLNPYFGAVNTKQFILLNMLTLIFHTYTNLNKIYVRKDQFSINTLT